jgi:hypothetical protein
MENVHPILQTLLDAAPYFNKMRKNGFIVGITDREKTLRNFPSKVIDLKIQDNQMLPPDDPMLKVMETGEGMEVKVSADLYGIPFKAVYMPVSDENGEIVGGLALGQELEVEEHVMKLTDVLIEQINDIATSVDNISLGTTKQISISKDMVSTTETAEEKYKQTDGILEFIHGVANQTNLLSLNARIEAARAGEKGRGFAVVANEVNKLGTSSAESVTSIGKIISEIKESNELVKNLVNMNSSIVEEQDSAVQKILSAVNQLNKVIMELKEIASQL